MAAELDKHTIAKAYARWAPVYDLVFGAVFDARPQGVDRGGRAGASADAFSTSASAPAFR